MKFPFKVKWWISNRKIQALSYEARGVMVEIMLMMMEGDPYGTLKIDGVKYDLEMLSKMLKLPQDRTMEILEELMNIGKDIQITVEGLIYSKEMKKEMAIHNVRKVIGSMGGNPSLKGMNKDSARPAPAAGEYKDAPNEVVKQTTKVPESTKAGEYYLSKKGKKLSGVQFKAFENFWMDFDYKSGKAEAADAWLNLKVGEELYKKIITGARREAAGRPVLVEKGSTPKMAEGWLSSRRWEDGK